MAYAPSSGGPVAGDLIVESRPLDAIHPHERNPRRHSMRQIKQIATSIREIGFTNPILIDEHGEIIAGHGRYQAAKLLDLKSVPTIELSGLTNAQKVALRIADNKLAENASWDPDLLAFELNLIVDSDYDVTLTGFETAEVDLIIEAASETKSDGPAECVSEPDRTQTPVSRLGDQWVCGNHRLLCGDATATDAYALLMAGAQAQMVITDPPYNVPINGHVSGLGSTRHREFVMASGEMSPVEFQYFLRTCCSLMALNSVDGAIHFLFMDWRHAYDLQTAVDGIYSALKNLVVWNKTNAGMGSLYRSKHELVFVYKVGNAPHINNVELGRYGRARSNVWDYAGVNTFRPGRQDELAIHPTVKPVTLVADAIKDCSKRKGIILDPFAGSGTILIAAEQTGRRAHAMEVDPHYVDAAVRRWQQQTGQSATHAECGLSFDAVARERANDDDGDGSNLTANALPEGRHDRS